MALRKFFIAVILLLLPLFSSAEVAIWKIIPDKSSINFIATQNNAPVTGKFNSFSGDIKFGPAQLTESSVRIIIDTNSITTSYKEVQTTLVQQEWFNSKAFPQAIFEAKKFTKKDNNSYQAEGMLTIRDKTVPVVVTFALTQYTSNHAVVNGQATIKRTAFNVGTGEWANTSDIKDDVKIEFVLEAQR